MKKRSVALLLLLCTVVAVFAGCASKDYDYDSLEEYIKLGNYKGVTINQSDYDYGIQSQWRSDIDADSTAKKDIEEKEYKTDATDVLIKSFDTVTIDYVGTITDEKGAEVEFVGGTANDYKLEIGSDDFIDGFEDGLIGYSVGDTVVLELKFPEDYGKADNDASKMALAGKPVKFKVTIDAISRKNYPELNDENVKKYFETSKKLATAKEYEDSVKEDIVRGLVWEELFEICKVRKYPEKELTAYYEYNIDYYTTLGSYYGASDIKTLCSIFGYESTAEFYRAMATSAKSSVKQELIILGILEKEPSLALNANDYEVALKALYEEQVAEGTFTENYKHFKKHNDEMSLKISVYYKEVSKFVEKTMSIFDDVTKNGFYTDRNGTQYYIDGEAQTGWVEIENAEGVKELYYFDPENKGYSPELCTFIKHRDEETEKWHQFDAKGKYIGLYSGAYNDSEGTRYFKDGEMITGWQAELNIDNKDDTADKYYFDPETGYMYVGYKEVKEEGKWHKFDSKTGAWVELAGDGLKADGENGTLYFKDSVLQTGLFELTAGPGGDGVAVDGKYYFDPNNNGYMTVKDAAECEEGVWYYFNDKGTQEEGLANGLIKNSSGTRYFVNGVLQTGEQSVTVDSKTNVYYFDPENGGYAYISKWLTETDPEDETKEVNKYYFDANGYKVTGKDLAIDGTTYTFDNEGNWTVKADEE